MYSDEVEKKRLNEERVKQSIKSVFATRIRQSVDKIGIDDIFNLICEVPLVISDEFKIKDVIVFKTKVKVPKSIRYANDAPFIKVTCDNFNHWGFAAKTLTEIFLAVKADVKGFNRYYTCIDNVLHLFIRKNSNGLTIDVTKITKAFVTSIFENPEEVIGMYCDDDFGDIELPFPNDMLESIILEVLKTEFGMQPAPEVEVKG